MKKIKISTDSTADIPVDVREKYDISVLPLTIIADGKEYKDSYDITPIEFYNLMEECKDTPTSSQVATSVYTEFFEKCLKDGYTDIIHTTLNSKGSGTYQAAVLSRDLFYEENPDAENQLKIHIIDSKLYTMAYGWAVVDAAQKVQNGENDVEKIIADIEEWVENARATFVPMTLKYVKKSGRVSAAAAFVGDALGLKPVISFENGESVVLTKIRGEKNAVDGLLKMVKEVMKPNTPYVLILGSNQERNEAFRVAAENTLGTPPAMECQVGCIIAINSGHDMVGITYRK